MRETRKSKENISGSGATGKGPYYDAMNFSEYCLQRRTMEMFQRQPLQLKFYSLIQMKLKWTILSKKGQPAGIKRGGKIQKLTAVDIGKQYLDSFKEIGNEWRGSWVRISATILIEEKRHRLLCVCVCARACVRACVK
jgi:hypothetical protein